MSNMTASNAKRLAMALKKNGVTNIFAQSNPFPIVLACNDLGIRQIGFRQENAGAYMAQAYGMCSGTVPVVAAQCGPAAALLVAGLAECFKAGHPVVAIVQDIATPTLNKNAFQELDHFKLFSGVSKWVDKIPCQERIEDYVDMAFVAAASGRPGPAVLLCPTDMFMNTAEYPVDDKRKACLGRYPLDRNIADPAKIEEAAELLANAERPFIYAGGGVISSGGQEEIRQIQEECAIPVATTSMGKGSIDEGHPLSMGPIGYYMGKRGYAKFLKPMVKEADVILLVGNRTNQNGTDVWTLLPYGATYIQIDVEPLEVGRNYEALRLIGDAKLTLAALKNALLKKDLKKRIEKRAALEAHIAEAKEAHIKEASDVTESNQSPVRIERFLAELDRHLTKDHIIVSDASFSSVWLSNYISAKDNRKFVFPRGIAGIGWGLPLAIGAKVAQPGRKVFCLAGDGGFAHVWSELETCRREKVNVVIAIINNSVLGYQKWYEKVLVGRYTNVCDLTYVDHVAIAEACGVKGIRVGRAEEIEGAIKEAFATDGPVLIDVMTDPRCVPPIDLLEKLDEVPAVG